MLMWLYHPIANVAILEIQGTSVYLSEYVLEPSFFEKDYIVPEREMSLTMYGMPDVYREFKFAPFTCDSKPASSLLVAHFCDR